MYLHTHSQQLSTNKVKVFWRTGEKNSGVLDITLNFHHDESGLIGELIALRYLLTEKCVFDRNPTSGKGYHLTVSRGAIKKLALDKSDKKFAIKYAALLTGKMAGCEISISNKMDWVNNLLNVTPEQLEGDSAVYAMTHEPIETPSIGVLNITRHAVEQFVARMPDGEMKNPWLALTKRLQNAGLAKRQLPEKVLKHKAKKYGRADNVEAWAHPASSFVFLVLRDEKGVATLVTVFDRNEE